jgi:RNA polymerase sigma-70 factor (ECF subfamily)
MASDRREQQRTVQIDAAAPLPSPDRADSPEDRESAEALCAALERLPERQREVLHLVFYQDLSIADAAEVMEISLGSARTHYERGKARLRLFLKEVRDERPATGS